MSILQSIDTTASHPESLRGYDFPAAPEPPSLTLSFPRSPPCAQRPSLSLLVFGPASSSSLIMNIFRLLGKLPLLFPLYLTTLLRWQSSRRDKREMRAPDSMLLDTAC
jgi:hypothetical protein